MMSIKELRTKAGMTQKAFAEYFGVSIKAVQSWEQGERKCPVYLLELMKYKLEKECLIVKGETKITPLVDRAQWEAVQKKIKNVTICDHL